MTFVKPNKFTETLELASHVIAQATALAEAMERKKTENGYAAIQGKSVSPEQSLAYCISGYCGEAAVALHLGLAPKTTDWFQNRPDVGGYDVMTSKRHNASLIFTPRNPLCSVKILVIDESPFFHLVGCYRCDDAREHREWWKEPRPGGGAWFVPQKELRAINSADDVRAIDQNQAKALDKFSHEWRGRLENEGIEPPKLAPLNKAIVDRMGQEPYGHGASLRNPGGNVFAVRGLDPKLATYRPRKDE